MKYATPVTIGLLLLLLGWCILSYAVHLLHGLGPALAVFSLLLIGLGFILLRGATPRGPTNAE